METAFRREDDTRSLVTDMIRSVSNRFVQRESVTAGLVQALIAKQHVLLLGEPGTGKSQLVNTFNQHLEGCEQFSWLMTRFTMPEELFGPISLRGLKEDRFRRVTDRKLPEAHVVFLDEIFKANSAILNALLTLINERRFYDDGVAKQVPLQMLVGASNELPDTNELAALHDRFLLRFYVEPVTDGAGWLKMLRGADETEIQPVPKQVVTEARAWAACRPITEHTYEALLDLRYEVKKLNIPVSDRRWQQSQSLLQAAAWLDGLDAVYPDCLGVLEHVLWSDPSQRTAIRDLVEKYAKSALKEAEEIVGAIVELCDAGSGAQPDMNQLSVIAREGKVASGKLAKLIKSAHSNREKEAIEALRAKLETKIGELLQVAKKALGV